MILIKQIYSIRHFAIFFALALSVILFTPNYSHANDVRILIVDDKLKSVPELNDLRRIGNVNGKLLFRGTEYSGKLEVFKSSKGLFVVNELPLEEYIKGVVKVEVAENWPLEALKAQAVAARTYAIFNIENTNNGIYHMTSSTLSQLFKGIKSDPDIEEAVNSTRGEIMTYNGKAINALYHSTSGGKTELPEEVFGRSYPYLRSVKAECTTSPLYVWERRIPKADLKKALGNERIDRVEIRSHTKTGRVKELAVLEDDSNMTISAAELRKKLGWRRLPSTWFEVVNKDNTVIFSGKGYGHGVGMCQWSAMEMANRGANYKEILSTFYPGTTIELHENR
ncbi:MAG: SpoIID/LytB domain-containing protein [Nitrospirota bacterium]|nr:MAG: SpoIID/LytB domain-containing protein [Nitrospirota bacterium]